MKNFNKNTEFVCTQEDKCLLNTMTSDEVIEYYFVDENGNDVMYVGKNMKDLFEEAINCETMHANDWEQLQIFMNTINLSTKESYIKAFYENYELDVEDSASCIINVKTMLNTLGYDYHEDILSINDDDLVQMYFDMAAILADYAKERYGGEWDYHYSEDCLFAWNKEKCEWKYGDVHLKE